VCPRANERPEEVAKVRIMTPQVAVISPVPAADSARLVSLAGRVRISGLELCPLAVSVGAGWAQATQGNPQYGMTKNYFGKHDKGFDVCRPPV
jgi:hypothetical protein